MNVTTTVAAILVTTLSAAHPIHTTLTVMTPDSGRHEISVRIRAFADDFSATVATFSGKPAPADSSTDASDVVRYVRAHFTVEAAAGPRLLLEPCGVERASDLYWLCFRVALPAGVRDVRVSNQMLTELHRDQVNIVQTEDRGERRTFLFTRGSAAATWCISRCPVTPPA